MSWPRRCRSRFAVNPATKASKIQLYFLEPTIPILFRPDLLKKINGAIAETVMITPMEL